jgi:hypothetical protein
MMNALVNALFGCNHRNTTFPLTSRRTLDHTYVVCLDCGTEFDYNWKEMRMGEAIRVRDGVAVPAEPALQAPSLGRFFA